LPFGWCCNNFGVIVNEALADGSAKELEVTVTMKTYSKGTSCSTKQLDDSKDGVQQEILKTIGPVVLCCTINQDESIPETANGEAIAESNIHMNPIKLFIFLMVDCTTAVRFLNHCI
jgi:hypothetical protein